MPAICKNIIILHLILLFGVSISYSNDGFKPSPEDTVNKFIKNYGKDSLIRLLDYRIKEANKWVNNNFKELKDQNTYAETILVGKHFNLSLDTMLFDYVLDSFNLYSLYGNYFGDTLRYSKMIDEYSLDERFDNLLIQNRTNKTTRELLAALCSHFRLNDKLIDSFYMPSKSFQIQDKIKSYLQLSELNRNCGTGFNKIKIHKDDLYTDIYKSYNLEKLLQVNREFSEEYVSEFIVEFPIQMIAYGLYGKNINIKDNGKELMYLLKLQNNDFGWKMYNSTKFDSKFNSTFYGLWALCEFREQLKKL